MKILIATLCLLSTLAFAQNPPTPPVPRPQMRMPPPGANDAGEALPENVLLKLTVKEKDQTAELSMVLATPQFATQASEPNNTSFAGNLIPQEDGTILVRYTLSSSDPVTNSGGGTNYVERSFQASARLRMGEPIQILKTGNRTYELSASRLAEGPKKEKGK